MILKKEENVWNPTVAAYRVISEISNMSFSWSQCSVDAF